MPNVLTAIVCIDRDADLASQLYNSLLKNNCKNIMIVTRESDIKTINFWKNKAIVKTIPHYKINGRHNFNKIAEKRQMVIDYSKGKYNAIWFVDSDVIPLHGTLTELLKTDKDICLAPCRVKWTGYPCVGIFSKTYPYVKMHKINSKHQKISRKPFMIGGFACTLIKNTTFNQKIEYGEIDKQVCGEDIGFFINCYNARLSCEYLTNWIQPHYYDR